MLLHENKVSPCTNCLHRKLVVGSSHHQECNHPIVKNHKVGLMLLTLTGQQIILTNEENGDQFPLIQLNTHGVKNGWANWPMDFDIIWVTSCGLRRLDKMREEKVL